MIGAGVWKRHLWGGASGKFVHQFTMLDIDTLDVVAFMIASDEAKDFKICPFCWEQ